MNNFQDELAWLNHRLDNKLEEWQKLHRLHGSFNTFLVYCLQVLIAIYAYFAFILASKKPSALYIIVTSFLAIVSLLVFSVLKWRLYTRLLTVGHKRKAEIDLNHITKPAQESFLKACQGNFNNLLRVERRFPFPDRGWLKRVKQRMNLLLLVRQLKGQLRRLEQRPEQHEGELKRIDDRISKLKESLKNTMEMIDSLAGDIKEATERAKSMQPDDVTRGRDDEKK